MDEEIVKQEPNIFLTSSTSNSDENFFASSPKIEWESRKQKRPPSGSRINDYDSTILEKNAYQAMPNEGFKLEHKIEILENSLAKINNEINALNGFGYEIQVYNLKDRKLKIEQELVELNKKYSELGLSAKISGQINVVANLPSKINPKILSRLKTMKDYLSKNILNKISKKFGYSNSMTEALNTLSNINSSVDELINMQTPYGENITRYEKLTAYLNKANVIHSQIYKDVNSITKKKP